MSPRRKSASSSAISIATWTRSERTWPHGSRRTRCGTRRSRRTSAPCSRSSRRRIRTATLRLRSRRRKRRGSRRPPPPSPRRRPRLPQRPSVPSERELRRRVRSIKNIQQVTRAMQLVAASKMRRAQAAVLASRPYEERLRTVLNELAPYADPETSPLLARREVRRVGIVIVTTDRGLVGPMNVNLIRATLRFAQQQPAASFIAVGRKGINQLRRARAPVTAEFPGIPDRPSSTDTNVIARVAVEEFVTGKVDEIHLAFTRFVNTLRQEPTIRRLLPFVPEEEDRDDQPVPQYLFEPDPETVLNEVIPRLIEIAVFQTILESKASAFSAQMVAMRNATDAAGDLIDDLTLAANKARQGRITKEMLEIASGAEALGKG